MAEKYKPNPQELFSKLRVNPYAVNNLVSIYSRRLTSPDDSVRLTPKQVKQSLQDVSLYDGRDLRKPYLLYRDAILGCAINAFTAAEQLGYPEAIFTPIEKLDTLTEISLTGAVRLLYRAGEPGSGSDNFNFGVPALLAESARKLVDLHNDGFGYDEIESHYFPKPAENVNPQSVLPTPETRSNDLCSLISDVDARILPNYESILMAMQNFENQTGQTINPEIRTAFFVLHNVARAREYLYLTFYRAQLKDLGIGVNERVKIPENESGQAFDLIDKAKDFTLAKIWLLAERDMGIVSLSNNMIETQK